MDASDDSEEDESGVAKSDLRIMKEAVEKSEQIRE